MRFKVLHKNLIWLENMLHNTIRYEALKPEHSAPLEAQTSAASPKKADESAYVYDKRAARQSLCVPTRYTTYWIPTRQSSTKRNVLTPMMDNGK